MGVVRNTFADILIRTQSEMLSFENEMIKLLLSSADLVLGERKNENYGEPNTNISFW